MLNPLGPEQAEHGIISNDYEHRPILIIGRQGLRPE